MCKAIPIAVILGTYNGERYLKEQIDSVLRQRDVSVHIFARDDGSKDSTIEILKEYEREYENFHLMAGGNTKNKGIRESFMDALKWAVSYSTEYDYFAFADQDDIWLPEKLITGIRKITDSVNANGALYYSNKIIVDDNLQIKYQEHFLEKNHFSNYYFVSRAYGCTMVINRTLAVLSCKYVSPYCFFHDSWIHRLAICLDSDMVFDEDAYVLYRQHEDNACGTFATDRKSYTYLMKRALELIMSGKGSNRAALAKDILEQYGDRLGESTRNSLELISNYKRSIWNKISLINKAKIVNRSMRDICIWRIKVFLGCL